jgi:hypothetical protein
VAFEQPIVGQPDVVPSDEPSGALVCDQEVAIGESALCDESCIIDAGAGPGEACGGLVSVEADRVLADVSALREVELTLTVCGAPERSFVLVEDEGGALAVDGRALALGPNGGAAVYRNPAFLPEEGEDCAERTIFLQPGRVQLAEAGQRLCSDSLPAFRRTWAMRMSDDGAQGLRSLEIYLRRAE